MRKIPMISAALLAVAAAGACGGTPDSSAEAAAPTTQATPQRVTISVTVETENGLIGHNHDDERCVFAEPEYELRDGAGTIIDVGRWEDDGVSVGPSEWAAAGEVESLDPYRCVLDATVTANPVEIYTLTVTAMEAPLLPSDPDEMEASGEVTFRRDQADDVTVEIQGSR
jgi:hypothetical protein